MKSEILFVGLHIHKCAGTTLQIYLQQQRRFRFRHTSPNIYYRNGLMPIDEIPAATVSNALIYWGHDIHESLLYTVNRPIFLFIFIREPVSRIISWYAYENRERGLQEPFATFVEQRRNSMCNMINNAFPSLAGALSDPLHQRATRVLENFGFIGTQEHFASHANRLLDYMEIPRLGNQRNNVSKPAEKSRLKAYRTWIMEMNSEDVALWARFAPELQADPILRPERCTEFFRADADTRFDDTHMNRLRLELADLNHFSLLPERRQQDQRIILRRLASLLLQSSDAAEREALIGLMERFSTLSGIHLPTGRPLHDERL